MALYCRLIYSCPDSTPIPSLRGEAGLLSMDFRIMSEKVCLVSRIMNMGDNEEPTYAEEVLREQLAMGWEGLAEEVVGICERVGLPNACTEFVGREKVKEAMMYSHLSELKEEYGMKKLKHLQHTELRYMQDYMKLASLEDSRVEYRYRVGMLDNRVNMGKKYKNKQCPHCIPGREHGVEESSQHWLDCEAYSELRRGMDPETILKDRVLYLRRVQLLRIELEKTVI